jgi:predicted DNA-binding transcriptional regulator AlpA
MIEACSRTAVAMQLFRAGVAMRREREQARPEEPPHQSSFRLARELNGPERLLTPRDAARILGISESWLAKSRMRGDGPPYVKLGRSVRYGEDDLAKWKRSRVQGSTSER